MSVGIKVTLDAATLELDKTLLKKVLRQAGAEVVKEAKALLRRGEASGRRYGRHTASAPGQSPATITGELAKSLGVKASRSGLSTTVTDSAGSATALETGSVGGGGPHKGRTNAKARKLGIEQSTVRKVAPRPFMEPALEKVAGGLEARIKKAVDAGIDLKGKPAK